MTFKLLEERNLSDIQSQGHLYEHGPTGAQVLWLENQDSNRSFTIAFKTPPYSDNGITHIIEHSVLNGSQKYPSKEPFVELLKGSLNTFLNAMTFSDKTVYPVASTNQKDFSNLMSVYLDAVFKPNFYHNPMTLNQEGWHYHLESADDDLTYKGVVFNEMKGATAAPEQQLYNHTMRVLYPDTFYAYESGGMPAAIPELTQEEFVDYHRRHYHPGNSLTVIYGDLDIHEALALLGDYFNDFTQADDLPDLKVDLPLPKQLKFKESYSLPREENPSHKDYLALAWHTSKSTDTLEATALEILNKILMGHNEAPLKKALLEADLAEDVWGDYYDFGYPGGYSLVAKYTEADKMAEFKDLVKKTLQTLVEEGIDRQVIEAAINKMTFNLKEEAISESDPRGIIFGLKAISAWEYDQAPFANLEFTPILKEIAERADQGYFEDLIQSKLLDNPFMAEIILTADPGKSDRQEAASARVLEDYKASLSQDQVEDLVANTQALIKRQEEADRPEDLAKIPSLTRQDLSGHVALEDIQVTDFKGQGQVYYSKQFTSGIDYLSLYFDISDLPADLYPVLSLYASLLGRIPSQRYPLGDLQTQLDLYTGGISAGIHILEGQEGHIRPYFVIKGKALEEHFDQLLDLMKEILLASNLTAAKDISKLVRRQISSFQNQINYTSHVLAVERGLSHTKPAYKLNELVSGIDYYNYLKRLRKQFKEGDDQELLEALDQVQDLLNNRQRVSLFYVGGQDRIAPIVDQVNFSLKELKSEPLGDRQNYQAGPLENEAFAISQEVNYVGLVANKLADLEASGPMMVLATILRYDYLWNRVRVKGGAYGALFRHLRDGHIMFSSYRDPNLVESLTTYLQVPEYISHLDLSPSDLLKYIIGTLSTMEQPLSAYDKGVKALQLYLTDQNVATLVERKQEVLNTQMEDILSLAEDFKVALREHSLVVIGNQSKIEANRDRFDRIADLY